MGGRKRVGTVRSLLLLATATSALNASISVAADLTITDARSAAVDTTTGDGTGPGNIIIQSAGSVTVPNGTAVTVNSSNTLNNQGSITNNGESNSNGVVVLTTKNGVANNITGSVTNLGTIGVVGPAITSAAAKTDVFNNGIIVTGLGTFTGDIVNDNVVVHDTTTNTDTVSQAGSIVTSGNKSVGVKIESNMIGNLTNRGSIAVNGIGSYAIATTGHITGNFTNLGSITASDTDDVGAYIGGGVDGNVFISGAIVTGTGPQLTTTNGINLITIPALPSKAGLWIASDVTKGIILTGNRLTLADEAKDPTTAAAVIPPDASINVTGGGPAILITQGGLNTTLANITVGSTADNGNYSIKNQGNLIVTGSISGLATSVISVAGTSSNGVNYTSTLNGGIWNDKGNFQTQSTDATAIGINVGNYGSVTRFQNDGDVLVTALDSSSNSLTNVAGTKGGPAYGVFIDTFGSLPSITNTGNIIVTAQGPNNNAYGIVDRSGTLTSITNSGLINTVLQDGNAGKLFAIDVSANTTGVNINNTGTIIGNVLIGSGNSTLTLTGTGASITGAVTFQSGATKSGNNIFTMDAGTTFGLVNLGNGNHTVTLTNGAKATGGLAQGTGTLTLSVDSSQLAIFNAHPLITTSASFTGTSVVTFDVNDTTASPTNGILQSSGTVTFGANAKLTAAYTSLIDGQKVITVVKANQLVLGAPLSQIATSPNSYINASTFSLSPTDANTLLLTVRRKSATELGLGANTTAIYNAFTGALNQDTPVVTAVSALQNKDDFTKAVRQLMPDTSGATLQGALNNQDMAAGAIRRRLVGVAKNGMPDHAAGDVASFWAQALGDYGDQRAHGEQAGFDIWGLGVAFGADLPAFDNTTNIGFALTETWHSINLQVARHSPLEFYNSQADLYARYNGEALYVQAIAGGGYNSYNQMRHVDFGGLTRIADGKWKGYEYGATVETGYAMRIDAYQLTPYVRASYLKHHENGYAENSGGTGIDLTVNARDVDNARASSGFTLTRDFPIYYDSYVEAELRANYTREFKNDPFGVTARYAVGPAFTNFSDPRSPNRANVGFGVAHKDSYSSVSVDYDAEISKGYLSHMMSITARFRF